MVRFEKDKLVIEIETHYPASHWLDLTRDLVRAIGAIDKDLVGSANDYIYSLCDFLEDLMPEESDLRELMRAKGLAD